MKAIKNIMVIILFFSGFITYAQSEENKEEEKPEAPKPKENSSEEVVTKIIRIKGANGEEKVIKQQQVITKKSEVKLNPNEEDNETNRTAVYAPQKVSVKNSGTTSNEKIYSSVPDGTGYILTLIDEKGEKISKAKLLSNGYYLINSGLKDNCLGHFDESKNLILETYNSVTDSILTLTYKLK
ncbi:hypothetical protein SAMN04487910_0855 [Aquimarina amphilecti]|uniref:Uncharacterized protein n=1 Tax=Aquimarina amphilecti TaxID=1038014 RepID=A0A1H7I4U7_AQUAM|nr:hypothetical protein [Aquimarina amphilecti]SEK57394.1 hypothetical protein SAMN04487910_0855 [Aquimarina amphilecti]